MKINIFGVGRSGTKAVQLYTSLLLLEKHNKVKLVYEPYLWKSRMGMINTEGIKMHSETPLFLNPDEEISTKHQKFIKNITDSEIPIVTKSIRASGRMFQFNKYSTPDLVFMVYRDIYNVLESITPQQWNFYTLGPPSIQIKYQDFWSSVLNFVESTNLPILYDLRKNIKNIHASMDKNAMIWYLSNLVMLCSNTKIDLILNQNSLHGKEQEINSLVGIESTLSFAKLKGSQIRKNDLIINADSSALTKSSIFKRKEPLSTGDIIQKVNSPWENDKFKEKTQRIKVLQNDMYDTMNGHIQELVQMQLN